MRWDSKDLCTGKATLVREVSFHSAKKCEVSKNGRLRKCYLGIPQPARDIAPFQLLNADDATSRFMRSDI